MLCHKTYVINHALYIYFSIQHLVYFWTKHLSITIPHKYNSIVYALVYQPWSFTCHCQSYFHPIPFPVHAKFNTPQIRSNSFHTTTAAPSNSPSVCTTTQTQISPICISRDIAPFTVTAFACCRGARELVHTGVYTRASYASFVFAPANDMIARTTPTRARPRQPPVQSCRKRVAMTIASVRATLSAIRTWVARTPNFPAKMQEENWIRSRWPIFFFKLDCEESNWNSHSSASSELSSQSMRFIFIK